MTDVEVLQEIRERIVRIETKLDNYNDLREKAEKAHALSIQNTTSIKRIEDNQTWLWRTVIGGLITGAIAAIFAFLKGGGLA